MERAPWFEPDNLRVVNHFNPELNPTTYMSQGPSTIFTIPTPAGNTRFTVDTGLDKDKQQKAKDRFNLKFKGIQDYYIDQLKQNELDPTTRWVCVRVGVDKGKWYQSDGSWEMLPTVLSGFYYNIAFKSLVRSGKISRDNLKNKYWVPSKYIYPPPVQTTSSDIDRYD